MTQELTCEKTERTSYNDDTIALTEIGYGHQVYLCADARRDWIKTLATSSAQQQFEREEFQLGIYRMKMKFIKEDVSVLMMKQFEQLQKTRQVIFQMAENWLNKKTNYDKDFDS